MAVPGSQRPNQTVVVGCHPDGEPLSHGSAYDDASGCINALGLARVLGEQWRQREAAHIFGKVLHRPALLPAPAFAMRALLGEQADLVLHGQRALSRKLDGYESRYRGLRAALEEAL